MSELWKQIDGADDYYEVSNYGRVRIRSHIDKNGNLIDSKLIAPTDNGSGYLQYRIMYRGKRKHKYAHRLVAEAFIENPLNLEEVDHIDDVRSNNRVDNLQWISRQDNMRKMSEKMRRNMRIKPKCSCGREKSDPRSKMCLECRNKMRRSRIPNRDDLISTLVNNKVNLSATGRYYSVTDNAIRKWCKIYHIDIDEIRGLVA